MVFGFEEEGYLLLLRAWVFQKHFEDNKGIDDIPHK